MSLIELFGRMSGCLLIAAALWPGPARAASGCDDLRGRAIIPKVSWQDEVKPLLNTSLGGRCTGCHRPMGVQPDLTDTGVDAIRKLVPFYVTPFDPAGSRLFVKVNCADPDGGGRMPLGSTPFTLAEQELIYDWIAQGAYGEIGLPFTRVRVFADSLESIRR